MLPRKVPSEAAAAATPTGMDHGWSVWGTGLPDRGRSLPRVDNGEVIEIDPERGLAGCADVFVAAFAAEPWNEAWPAAAARRRLPGTSMRSSSSPPVGNRLKPSGGRSRSWSAEVEPSWCTGALGSESGRLRHRTDREWGAHAWKPPLAERLRRRAETLPVLVGLAASGQGGSWAGRRRSSITTNSRTGS